MLKKCAFVRDSENKNKRSVYLYETPLFNTKRKSYRNWRVISDKHIFDMIFKNIEFKKKSRYKDLFDKYKGDSGECLRFVTFFAQTECEITACVWRGAESDSVVVFSFKSPKDDVDTEFARTLCLERLEDYLLGDSDVSHKYVVPVKFAINSLMTAKYALATLFSDGEVPVRFKDLITFNFDISLDVLETECVTTNRRIVE